MTDNKENLANCRQKEISRKNSRRSSFFNRRLSSIYPDINSPITSPVVQHRNDNQKEELHLTELINKFKKENDDWKDVLNKLKKENTALKEKCSEVLDHTLSSKLLTEEDQRFLQARPDYASIGRLLDSTVEAVILRQRRISSTCTKVNNLIKDCNQNNAEVTERLISHMMHNFDELDFL